MRLKIVVCALAIALMFMSVSPTADLGRSANSSPSSQDIDAGPVGDGQVSQAGDSGSSLSGTMFMSRSLTGLGFDVLNTYAEPASHAGSVSLSQYELPGWTLYNVTIDMDTLTALRERVVVGQSSSPEMSFMIDEYNDFNNFWYSQLTQGFYNRGHDGRLENYTVRYATASYAPASRGTCYFVVLSDYQNLGSAMTSPVAMAASEGAWTWTTISGENAVLSKDTVYYTSFNGTGLYEDGFGTSPEVYWGVQTSTGSFLTRYYDTASSAWVTVGYESLLNYTYTPWNTTTSSALTFADPSGIALSANASSLTGTRWTFQDTDGIRLINFDSNLSASIGYNMTLWYSKSVVTNTLWSIPGSAQSVTWNQSFALSYPSIPTGTVARFANLTRMTDWTPAGLYLGTSASDHDDYTIYGKTAVCATVGNGTWTMVYSALNYAAEINAATSVAITSNFDITAYFRDSGSVSVSSGSSNLTIWSGSAIFASPDNETETDGTRTFSWDVSTSTSLNGLYRIEVFWTNGTEAGYRTQDFVVYYPTTLTAVQSSILAYTNSSFQMSVLYEDTFNNGNLTSAEAAVVYSFDGGPHTAMANQSDGTWLATVSTVGKVAGMYSVTVNASGYALQNQTTSIDVELIYDTQPLSVDWIGGSTITYVESTRLVVEYRFVNGTAVPNAVVNATDGTNYWTLDWSPSSGTYNYTFDGNMDPPGIGAHSLTVNAWKAGYRGDTSPASLTITTEPTSVSVQWDESSTITYIESTMLVVNYTMNNGTSVLSATVTATIGLDTWPLSWNGTVYVLQFNGFDPDPGLGVHDVAIQCSRFGFITQTPSTTLTVNREPTTLDVDWVMVTIDWTDTIVLVVTYRDSALTPIVGATQRDFIVNGTSYSLSPSGGTYNYSITNLFDLGFHTVFLNLSRAGYDPAFRSDVNFTIIEEITSVAVSWNPTNVTIYYTGSLDLTVDYTYSGGDVPSSAALVNVTIGEEFYVLTYTGTVWTVNILGADLGRGVFQAVVSAWRYGYAHATNITYNINVTLAPNMFAVEWQPSGLVTTYAGTVNITVYYLYNSLPVPGATVRLILNSSMTYDFALGMDDAWHLSLGASVIDLGIWNATILANQTGYDTGREERLLTVNPDTCTITPEWVAENIYYTHQIGLNVTVRDSIDHVLTGALVRASFNGANYTLTHLSNGLYRLILNGSTGLGPYSIRIYLLQYGYVNSTTDVSLTVLDTPTSLVRTVAFIGFNSSVWSTLYHDGLMSVRVYCEDTDNLPLVGLTVTLTIGSSFVDMTDLGNGTYVCQVTAVSLGVGYHPYSVAFSLYGYEDKTDSSSVTVYPVPTHIVIAPEIPAVMYINQTVVLTVDYVNDHTGARVGATSVSVSWSLATTPLIIETGRYEIELSSLMLALANHQLNITLVNENYTTGQIVQSVTVRAVQTTLSGPTSLANYEYCNVLLQVTYQDVDHGTRILSGSVNASLDGDVYQLAHVGNGVYTYLLNLTMEPSAAGYEVLFVASADGCSIGSTDLILFVDAKSHVYIELDTITAVQGESISVAAWVRYTDSEVGLSGATVNFYIWTELQNGSVLTDALNATTNAAGYASQVFRVPIEAKSLVVMASFPGSDSIWRIRVISEAYSAQAASPLVLLFRTLTNPVIMGTIIAVVVLGGGARLVNVSRRPKKAEARRVLEDQMRAFRDLNALRHFMAVYLNRGTCVFYHPFTEQKIQPDLISGFISAVTSVYGEIKGDGVQGTLEEIHYHGLRLNSYSGKYVIGILILEGEMTPHLRERLQIFVEGFETRYADDLEGWTGLTDCFDNSWIVSKLYSVFEYSQLLPHALAHGKRARGFDAKVFKAVQDMVHPKQDFLFGDVLVPVAKQIGKTELEVLDSLLRLKRTGAIVSIGAQAAIARQTTEIVPLMKSSEEPEITAETAEETPREEVIEPPISGPVEPEAESIFMSVERPSEAEEKPSEADLFLRDVEALLVKEAAEGGKAELPKEQPKDESETARKTRKEKKRTPKDE